MFIFWILFGILLIGILLYFGIRYIVQGERSDRSRGQTLKHHCDKVNHLKILAQRLPDGCREETLIVLDHLYENFRFADPLENEQAGEIDMEIEYRLDELQREIKNLQEIEGDSPQGVADKAKQIETLLIQRVFQEK